MCCFGTGDDLIGEPLCLLHVLGGEKDGGAGVDELLDELPEVVARARIEAATTS
jgi:hypothetical protein